MYIEWPVCGSSLSVLPRPSGLGCCGNCVNNFPVGRGLGYFASGLDLSGWGVAEWATVAAGVYVLFSVLSTTRRGLGRARRTYQKVREAPRRRARVRAERLRGQAEEIERRAGVGFPGSRRRGGRF